MYKIGDKVETPFGIGVVVNKGSNYGNLTGYDIEFKTDYIHYKITMMEQDLKPYVSAHDKLLARGYRFWDNSNGLQYNKGNIEILIDKEKKVYKVYWMVDYQAYEVDLELSRILTQLLEEV